MALPGLDVDGKEIKGKPGEGGHSSPFGENMKGTLDLLGKLGEVYRIVGSRLEFEVLLIRHVLLGSERRCVASQSNFSQLFSLVLVA